MSKRTLFLIFALVIITATLFLVAYYQPKPLEVTPTPVVAEPVEQTVLSFANPIVATSSSVSVLNYSLPVNIATGKNKVTAVQLELQYDPKVLTDVKITPGSFFTKPEVLLNQIDVKTGRISYAFGVGLTGQGITGTGTVANITFTSLVKVPTQTQITVLPKTLVTAQDATSSVLKQTDNFPFMVGAIPSSPNPASKL